VMLGSPYRHTKESPGPEPLVARAGAEATLHLASLGLALPEPSPLVEAPEPEPPPVIEIDRTVERSAKPLLDALTHWIDMVRGSG
jgi:hypothetical protein